MKLHYDQDTDSLYIDLANEASADSKEVADGLVLDFSEAGQIVGIDIQHASERLDLTELTAEHLPLIAA
jgi:uncharacterized protein YuzE